MTTEKEHIFLQKLSQKYPRGDFLIAGTYDGNDVMAIRKVSDRHITVIDSFLGLSVPSEQDVTEHMMIAGECNIGGLDRYLENFRSKNIKPPEEIYPIWITQDSIKNISERQIAVLFLDLDHYLPTKICLEYFGRWTTGAILVHDYDYKRCPGIKIACDEYLSRLMWTKVPETGFAIYKR